MKPYSLYQMTREGDLASVLKHVKKHGREILLETDSAYDQTCLHLASEFGHRELVTVLLEKFKVPVSPNDKNGWAPLHSAANEGHIDICQVLLEHGAFAPARTVEGTSALHYLARVNIGLRRGAFRLVVKKMLQGGADLNCQNRHGLTPLHEAALRGNFLVVQVLLEFDDLAVDATTAQGETALIYAARGNFPNILNLLLDVGANCNHCGSEGTALDVAVFSNRREAAKALRARVRDPCKMCGRPYFPLCYHVAAPRIWEKFTDEQKGHAEMRLSADLCQAHDDWFIRGIIEIPIISSNATAEIAAQIRSNDRRHQPGQLFLSFGVYVQVSKESFSEYVKHWKTPGREELLEPIDGFLANVIPHWKSIYNVPCKLVCQPVGCRPLIIVDSSHQLRTSQQEGIPFSFIEQIKTVIGLRLLNPFLK